MIDLSLKKTKEIKDNPFHPNLVTETIWESSNCKIIQEFLGGISSAHLFHVFYEGEEIGSFKQDFAKYILNQIKDVFLVKFPDIKFNR